MWKYLRFREGVLLEVELLLLKIGFRFRSFALIELLRNVKNSKTSIDIYKNAIKLLFFMHLAFYVNYLFTYYSFSGTYSE